MPDLLEKRRDIVLQYRHSKDAYTRRDISDTLNLNLNHVVELHFLRDCYDIAVGSSVEKMSLLSFVKSVANKTHNLNFTSQAINQAKHCAVKQFCDDFKSNLEQSWMRMCVPASSIKHTFPWTMSLIFSTIMKKCLDM